MNLFRVSLCRSLATIGFLAFSLAPLHGGESGKQTILAGKKGKFEVVEPDAAMVTVNGSKASASRVLVKFKKPVAGGAKTRTSAAAIDRLGMREKRSFKSIPGLRLVELKPGIQGGGLAKADDLRARIKALRETGLFEYVEPDWQVHLLQEPTDSAFVSGELWGLRNTGQNGGTSGIDVNVVPAWQITTGDPGIVVGVVDTGIRYTHQDLAGNMWVNPGEIPGNGIDDNGSGYVDDVHGINAITGSGDPFDDNDHGTHVAGTIAATANDSGPHVGVAPNVRLMGLKFLAASGSGTTSDAITCIEYAIANGAGILNNSWGGGGSSNALRDAIQAANDAGILFVAAAGNSSSDNDETPSYPSNYDVPNVVSVAAIDRNGALADFSSYGAAMVDIGAPGVSIFSSTSGSDSSYDTFSGTSMAAPHVAGVAALVMSGFPSAELPEIRNRLLASAAPLPSLAGRVATGGMVDAEAALLITEDGDLEMQVIPGGLVEGGQAVDFFVSVTDLVPVTEATVTASLAGGPDQVMRNDGVTPDVTANDSIYSGTFIVPSGQPTVTIEVEAGAPTKNPQTRSITFNVVARPTNDDFANRIVIPPGLEQSVGKNRIASTEPGEPVNPSLAGGKTVWWEWVSPADGSVTITTFGSDYDTALAIYQGTSLGSLTLLGANDDTDGLQSSVTFNAAAGASYQIQVDGYSGAEGEIQLNHPTADGEIFAPLIVTHPANRTVVVGNPFTLSVTVAGEAPLAYQWFQDDAPIPGGDKRTYSVDAASMEDDAGTYRVEVSNVHGSATSNNALVTVDPVGLTPMNDRFIDAVVLTGSAGTGTGTTATATGEPGEPDHADSSSPLASVWYQWTATEAGWLSVDTFGSDFDTTLAIYTGERVDLLTESGSNDDGGIGLQSRVSIPVTAGTSYRIAVDGFGSEVGRIVLSHSFTPINLQVPNDDFADRIPLPPGGGAARGSNFGATGEPGEPVNPSGAEPLASVWWSWTAPEAGAVTVSTAGSDFDTTLAVYTGDAVDSLILSGANDDNDDLQSEVSFVAQPGVSYQIAVDGFGDKTGEIALSVAFAPASGSRGAVLLIEDQSGFGTAEDILRGSGFDVTVVNYEFGNGYANLLTTDFFSPFDLVVYGERGGGSGAAMLPAVRTRFESYIDSGGHVLVTGHNTLGNPADAELAALVRAIDPGEQSSDDPTWATSQHDHPILNGLFGDFREQTFAATGYGDDALTADTAAGAVELIATGEPRVTGKLIFTSPGGSAGSVGYWNGGLPGSSTNAQPDFSDGGKPQAVFLNYAAFAVGTPGLAVERAGTPLPAGSARLNFGSVALNLPAQRVLTMRNLGTASLAEISMGLEGSHASEFSIASAVVPSVLEPGESFEFTLSFTPAAAGARGATLRIMSNDPARNPFEIALSGTGGTALDLYLAAVTAAGLAGGDAATDAAPFGGPENLLKYALNMNLTRADSSRMVPDGTSGLPLLRVVTTEEQGRHWVCEFVRRKGAGLVYTPMRSPSLLPGTFVPITGTETVSDIDDFWERIVIEGEYDLASEPSDFAMLEIRIP